MVVTAGTLATAPALDSSGPATEYRARAAARRATRAALRAKELRISHLRLAVFGTAGILGALVWRDTIGAIWLLFPAIAFAALVVVHERVMRAADAAARAEALYERGLARIEDRWIGAGETGERFRDADHLYAADLDLFGRGSLFELLTIARTRAGEEALADWLKNPASPAEVLERHESVRELTGELDLREALSIAGADVRAGVHSDELVAWAEGPPRLEPWHQWAALAMTAATILSGLLLVATGYYVLLLTALGVQGFFQLRQRRQIESVLNGAEMPARDLAVLRELLQHLERHQFTSPRLVALRERVSLRGIAASAIIRQLQRMVEARDWERNMMFGPVAALLMWGTHVAYAVERWRAGHGRKIGAWLAAVGEIEALSSLSAYRYEHPGDPFPEIVAPAPRSGRALFDGAGLGHPLLPSAVMVRNDVRIGEGIALLVLSGSNMSGKSTLLRTVGVNAVLAFAGAPVRAASLRISPVAIGATLRIQDSLQAGRSRFYAEITRIRSVVDRARGARPMLFLFDELFHGTNSHDRLTGASAVLRCLLDVDAIGFVTTHDLALTAVADQLAPRAHNVHFEDRFEGGEMIFDYRMKPGPVTRSNALALMRAVGLQVDE